MQSSVITRNEMTLKNLLQAYEDEKQPSKRYRESLLRTIRKAQAIGLTKICQLAPEPVNRFLAGLPVGATTRSNIRRELLTLWRYAYETDRTAVFPARISRIRPTHAPPQAWSADELSRLLETAERDATPLGGVTSARVMDVLPAWIGIAYDSGLRFSDVLTLDGGNFRNGCVNVVAGKTGKPLVRRLSEGTEQAVAALLQMSPDGSLFAWAMTRRRAIKTWRAFLLRHGFNGSSKWLRRSCATYVEKDRPGGATAYLQHSHPMLAPRHYLDESLFSVPQGPPAIVRSSAR
jgi:integrase